MEITSETEWMHPVRLRVAGKVLPSRNVGVMFEPIISRADRSTFGHQAPDRCVGAYIALAGPDELEDGRLEFWTRNTWGTNDGYPFIYFVFENVEWSGSFGLSGQTFGFVYTTSRRTGRRVWLSHQPRAKI